MRMVVIRRILVGGVMFALATSGLAFADHLPDVADDEAEQNVPEDVGQPELPDEAVENTEDPGSQGGVNSGGDVGTQDSHEDAFGECVSAIAESGNFEGSPPDACWGEHSVLSAGGPGSTPQTAGTEIAASAGEQGEEASAQGRVRACRASPGQRRGDGRSARWRRWRCTGRGRGRLRTLSSGGTRRATGAVP